MTRPGSVLIRWALLAMLLVFASPLWAANCTAVFSDPDGTNSNLQAAGNTLDLSGVPFANNPWPASGGTPLSSGDYYYSADNLGNNYRLNVANGATVRIFVNGSLTVGNNFELNRNGEASQLLLVVDGSFSTGNNPVINGLVYASGSINIGNNADITGGLAAGGAIAVGNTGPNTDYSGVGLGLLAGLCTPPVELSANGQTVGPVVVGAGENVLLSVAGSGCPAAGPFLYQQWTDRWTINNDQSQSASFNSVCDRSPVTRTVTFDAPGNYTVQFEAVYRSCFLFWCGEPQLFGIDRIVISVVSEAIDHFEIIHDGVALTCQPETVTIRACADAACDSPAGLFTDPVTATLAPESGWVTGNPVTFTGGVGQATLQNTTGGVVPLDVVGFQPSTRPQSVTLCDNGSGTLSSANCNLAFFESGLAFDVPNLLSHRPSGPVEIRAVRQDPQTQACVPAFENVQKTVRFWSGYVDPGPNGRPVSRPLTVNGTEVSGDAAAPTDLMLGFGPGGIAEVDVTYPDAGQVTLDARYVGSPATNDDGLVMPGADSFISVPVGLCVSAAGECPAGDDSCPVFVRADEVFELSLTAVGWESAGDTDLCQGNPVTPNFRLLDIPLTSAVMAPAGGRGGNFNPVSYTHARSADATTRVDARVSEVGVFEFTAAPNAGSYLGLSVDGGTSPPVGRFYPDRFRVSVDPGELDAACTAASPYTYTGQDFDWFTAPALQIEPLSVLGAPTENYTEPGFQRLTPTGVARSFPTQDRIATDASGAPMVLERTFSDGAVSVLAPGLLQYQYAPGDTFRYTKTPDTRVTPFSPELEFQVNSVTDSDGVNASAAPYEFTPEADFPIRYGRLAMENVYGPETLAALQMPFRLEYWDGGRYILNTDDSCTPWTTTTIAGTADHHTLVPDAGTFTAGEAQPLVLKPDGSRGTDTLVWNLADWLREDMNGDGGLDDPSATATFGVYRGHDRVIYWQEKP